MQIVAEIPDKFVKDFEFGSNTMEDRQEIYKCVRKGVQLPKGHGDLVDYEELKNNARECSIYAEVTLSHIKPKTIIEADKEESEYEE